MTLSFEILNKLIPTLGDAFWRFFNTWRGDTGLGKGLKVCWKYVESMGPFRGGWSKMSQEHFRSFQHISLVVFWPPIWKNKRKSSRITSLGEVKIKKHETQPRRCGSILPSLKVLAPETLGLEDEFSFGALLGAMLILGNVILFKFQVQSWI